LSRLIAGSFLFDGSKIVARKRPPKLPDIFDLPRAKLRRLPPSVYIQTQHWKKVATQRLKTDGFACASCGSKSGVRARLVNAQAQGCEEGDDVLSLCQVCWIDGRNTTLEVGRLADDWNYGGVESPSRSTRALRRAKERQQG
jgi:hypothetical protein